MTWQIKHLNLNWNNLPMEEISTNFLSSWKKHQSSMTTISWKQMCRHQVAPISNIPMTTSKTVMITYPRTQTQIRKEVRACTKLDAFLVEWFYIWFMAHNISGEIFRSIVCRTFTSSINGKRSSMSSNHWACITTWYRWACLSWHSRAWYLCPWVTLSSIICVRVG